MSRQLPKLYKLRKDRFTKARGGSSQFVIIQCASCQAAILLYQKDGQGQLIRLYLDRIYAPTKLAELQDTVASKTALSSLYCSNNHQKLLAVPMLYKPEKRLAYRLLRGAVHSRENPGYFPEEIQL